MLFKMIKYYNMIMYNLFEKCSKYYGFMNKINSPTKLNL